MTGSRVPLLVIVGPTAVGKTDLAIAAAERFGGEIINADSRQIYREMNIGTAKPDASQRSRVPHHLIDIVNPDESLTAAEFQAMANETIASIHRRGHLPILAGGTGQYITAILEGWTIPKVPPNPALRASLEAFAAESGAQALHDRLRLADPEAAETIHVNNVRRVIRALEVCEATGRPFSDQRRKSPPPYHVMQVGLTMDREALYAQADQRVLKMMQAGFLDEVRSLLAKGYGRDLPSMSGLGYAQLAAHLGGTLSLDEAIRQTMTATHDFIRRQYTWFRGHDSGIRWVDRAAVNDAVILAEIDAWLTAFGAHDEA